ncbi:MAG TPA: hypothetical protein DDY98_09510 [Ruminococcaceae bacterium]|nr:hypothetical protein [Oscillospiraceae bacterium]
MKLDVWKENKKLVLTIVALFVAFIGVVMLLSRDRFISDKYDPTYTGNIMNLSGEWTEIGNETSQNTFRFTKSTATYYTRGQKIGPMHYSYEDYDGCPDYEYAQIVTSESSDFPAKALIYHRQAIGEYSIPVLSGIKYNPDGSFVVLHEYVHTEDYNRMPTDFHSDFYYAHQADTESTTRE